jgi:hypothetical protein
MERPAHNCRLGVLSVTLLYTVIAAGLLKQTHSTLKETRKAVSAAKVSADTAKLALQFVAHGLITYRDVFPSSEPYKSHFCWLYLPPPNSSDAQGSFYIEPKELNWTT